MLGVRKVTTKVSAHGALVLIIIVNEQSLMGVSAIIRRYRLWYFVTCK